MDPVVRGRRIRNLVNRPAIERAIYPASTTSSRILSASLSIDEDSDSYYESSGGSRGHLNASEDSSATPLTRANLDLLQGHKEKKSHRSRRKSRKSRKTDEGPSAG